MPELDVAVGRGLGHQEERKNLNLPRVFQCTAFTSCLPNVAEYYLSPALLSWTVCSSSSGHSGSSQPQISDWLFMAPILEKVDLQ